jgi:hypothetical protein
MNKFEQHIWMTPAFDKRPQKPGDPDYGVHGLEIMFVLKCPSEQAGLSFNLMTHWQLPHVTKEHEAQGFHFREPLPSVVSLHKLKLNDEPHTTPSCNVVDGPCGSDSYSYCLGEDLFKILVAEGHKGLWTKMEEVYENWMKS